jgi:hypothetical protein
VKYLIATLSALILLAPVSAAAAKTVYWSEFDATQRLSIGRFAARNGIDHAVCLATGPVRISKYGERSSTRFDCRVGDSSYEHERQLYLRVTGRATFVVTWLKPQVCTDSP